MSTTMNEPTKTIWVTREGERIPVRKMTDSHLINAIRYLRRTAEVQQMEATLAIGQYLDDDPPDGAWMAATAAERDLESMDTDEFAAANVPTFEAMLAEAEKRGIKV